MADGFVVRSVTLSEVVDDDGESYLTLSTTGEPADHHVLGMIAWAHAACTADATWPDEDDE
jgi:hypothetical protein